MHSEDNTRGNRLLELQRTILLSCCCMGTDPLSRMIAQNKLNNSNASTLEHNLITRSSSKPIANCESKFRTILGTRIPVRCKALANKMLARVL